MHKGVYNSNNESTIGAKRTSQSEYIEEESYVNPPNVESQSEFDFEDEKIRSLNEHGILQSLKENNHHNIDNSFKEQNERQIINFA
jgi:hypothetical protein